MWVIKIGGSLNGDPALQAWLDLLVALGGGRVTVVCGGGRFADEVRRAQSHWQFNDLTAHNMAVLAMAQTAYLAHGLSPTLQLAHSAADIRRALHAGRTALWLPTDWIRAEADDTTNWDTTSDGMALDLARKLNAERLVLVKSCVIAPNAALADLCDAGVLDRCFARIGNETGFPIDVVHSAELARVRSMLLHGHNAVRA